MKESIYVCENCGNESAKWQGKCPQCGEWNSLKEMKIGTEASGGSSSASSINVESLGKKTKNKFERILSGISEFDLVMGGGIVKGSIVLIGGEPGIGKSTLILQVAGSISQKNNNQVLYISGEESLDQIRERAKRLKISSKIDLATSSDVSAIASLIRKRNYALVVIDSIQTMTDAKINGFSGSLSQVKASALILQKAAKETNTPIILIGHITKQGHVAGPKTLEHLVDAVIYLEGERFQSLRMLRSSKNRFGSVNEMGVFEIGGSGFRQIKNIADGLIESNENDPGSSITTIFEGTRPFLVEIQSLAAKSYLDFPQRKSLGYDYNRMLMIIAVLMSKTGLRLYDLDVFVSVVGGFKINDPSADLAVALAICSAVKKRKPHKKTIVLGEIGLKGDIRSVASLQKKILEAKRLGFKRFIVPKLYGKVLTSQDKSIKIIEVRDIREAIKAFLI